MNPNPPPALSTPVPSAWCRGPTLVAITALLVVGFFMALIAAAPLYTADMWWHLKAGEMYATDGMWPARDWMLHSPVPDAPIQHEWLFGVALHYVAEFGGFYALRAVHALAVILILASVAWIARAQTGDWLTAGLVTVIFTALAWLRLAQLRPDLVSIPLTLGVFHVLLAGPRPPGWRAIAALAFAMTLWSNVHSLSLLGPNLIIAALLGLVLYWLGARWFGYESNGPSSGAKINLTGGRDYRARWAKPLLIALVVGLVAMALNPRGLGQHLTAFSTHGDSAMWHIGDEWSHFQPLSYVANNKTVGFLQWLLADLVIVSFGIAVAVRGWQVLRSRSEAAWVRFDPIGFGLGLAGLVAAISSIRFLWMLFIPMVYVFGYRERGAGGAVEKWVRIGLASLSALVALGFTADRGPTELAARFGGAVSEYFSMPYRSHNQHAEGVRFLRESGVAGRLYNEYWMGGFLGYWLAPRIKVFVDGRTEHYSFELYREYSAVAKMLGARPNESHLDILDRRGVNLFFGIGFPGAWYGVNTTGHLSGMTGWLLVSRSFRHAIYLRASEAERANLDAIERYYRRQGVPFDRTGGLDPSAVITANSAWAMERAMLPPEYPALRSQLTSPVGAERQNAREVLASIYWLNGAYRLQVDLDAAFIAAEADGAAAQVVRARLIDGYLRMGDIGQARVIAIEHDRRLSLGHAGQSGPLTALVKEYARVSRLPTEGRETNRKRVWLNELLQRLNPVPIGTAWAVERRIETERWWPPRSQRSGPPGERRAD